MARKGKKRQDDFLAGHGMDPMEQHAATMRAAAVPVSDFEGYYPGPGTYNSPGAQRLQKATFESRMRREMDSE